VSYPRPARQALTEIAPGSTYYVRGYGHEVSGLDLGVKGRAVRQWRVCPSCGYVRTLLAAEETGSCERCGDAGIADSGQLYQVLVPTRVTSRDRRDDARIGDDDDRERISYTTLSTVDMGGAALTASWRHTAETFGVDYTRPPGQLHGDAVRSGAPGTRRVVVSLRLFGQEMRWIRLGGAQRVGGAALEPGVPAGVEDQRLDVGVGVQGVYA
jgi:hypothetical protein